ncbi:TadE family protein [Thermobrachium celere]|uniref:Flp pilus assembly protein TadG n=1 Tax=Thermobrachium celere DSM 8682 TaxID=941824 RepID=R7RU10_9CLOT|nr:TadE family protein [Thermobrachium celere]CDF58760.1 flp pilus assembly protein TadG [Thermobrachium celere DSM 8682]
MKRKGQALIEFSIILPILLLIVMGIAEFGMILNSYLTIQTASREGARIGIIGADDNEIVQAVYKSTQSIDKRKINITITPSSTNRKSGDTLKVRVEYEYDLIIPIIKNILGNKIELSAETSMRVE